MHSRTSKYLFLLSAILLPLAVVAQPHVVCQNNPTANYHVIGSPGSTFTWNTNGGGIIVSGQGNDSVTVSWNPTPGSYTLSVFETSADGCVGPIRTLDINVVSYATTINASICQGQTYTLPNGTTVNSQGVYPVILTSYLGCDSVVTTNLSVISSFSVSVDAQICQGQTYTLPNGTVVSTQGTYPVTLTSSGGCDSVVITNLTVNNTLSSTVNAAICQGQTYLLPNGVAVGTAGSYPVTLASSGGCDSIVTTNLTVNQPVSRVVDVSICEGSSYYAGGANQAQTGTYIDVFPGSNGCDSIITTNLTVTNTIRVNVNPQICTGQSYTLPRGTVVSAGGTYQDTLASSAGCDSIVTTTLNVLPVSNTTLSAEICEGDSYTLPDGSNVDVAGSYPVILTSSSGCDSTITTVLTVKSLPSPISVDITTICNGDSFVLNIQTRPEEVVIWPDGSSGNSYIFTATGSYPVSITNECGTVNSIIEVIAEDCKSCDVFLPNAFTPNGDNVNDKFTPLVTCDEVVPFLFRVYNRWNELIFETDQPGVGWDGTYKGVQQPTDSYIYYVSYFNADQGKSIIKKGVVSKLN